MHELAITEKILDVVLRHAGAERVHRVLLVVSELSDLQPLWLRRAFAELAAGTNFPAPLQKMIYRCQDDPEAVRRVGIHWATEQCRDLIDHDVHGIHFYTLNQSDATRRIYQTLGAKDSAALR